MNTNKEKAPHEIEVRKRLAGDAAGDPDREYVISLNGMSHKVTKADLLRLHHEVNTFVLNNTNNRYDVVDKDGKAIPDHCAGRKRTFVEAEIMAKALDLNGENPPYSVVEA